MNPVVHFEMPAEDKERMKKFYTETFGWEMQQMGDDYGDYVVVMTTKSDDKGPIEKGIINGGFYERTKDMPLQHPSVVISVPDIEAHMKKVKEAGGKVLGEPMDIPKVGKYVSFEDTEGNRVSMMQPEEM